MVRSRSKYVVWDKEDLRVGVQFSESDPNDVYCVCGVNLGPCTSCHIRDFDKHTVSL